MKFIIIGKNIDVTPGLKDAVTNKLKITALLHT